MRRRTKKRIAVLSIGYWFGAHSLGLLLHPYVSMRRIVREEVFVPLTLLPLVSLGIWWVVALLISRWNVLATLGLGFLAVRLERFSPTQILLSLLWMWGVWFFLIWQVLLLYLYRRFQAIK